LGLLLIKPEEIIASGFFDLSIYLNFVPPEHLSIKTFTMNNSKKRTTTPNCTLYLIPIIFMSFCSQKQEVNLDNGREQKPNIIYILADDLGFGDLGVYGQDKIETPNIDRLAASGMLFRNHYTGSTVCAPSRSALLTGLHTGHTPIRGNKELIPEGQEAMPDSIFTIGKMMKQAGYATGAFGKWGLGFVETSGDPINQGFDTFFGYNCQRIAHRYYPEYLWENQEKYYLEGNDWENQEVYAQDIIHDKTMAFLEANKEKPFFMFVPLVAPHAELAVPDDEIFHKYRKKFGEEQPFVGGEGADYGSENIVIAKYQSQLYPRATYAAMVERIDRYVGEILDKVEEMGLTENTVILFASDNGPHREGGNDPDFFNSNGDYRGYKRDLYEGGIRTPFIVKWPGIIAAGTENDHISAFWDVLPTLAEIIGFGDLPKIDGISFLPSLQQKDQKEHDYLYWEFVEQGGKQAIRKGDWKVVKLNAKNPKETKLELYNLKDDPSEKIDLALQYPELVAEMDILMQQAHVTNPIFPLFGDEGGDRP